MARGWESKSVESQIEEAADRKKRAVATELKAAEIALQRERESVELSRTRVLQDLAAAENPNYRKMLERSLAFLDEKLAALDGGRNPANITLSGTPVHHSEQNVQRGHKHVENTSKKVTMLPGSGYRKQLSEALR